jgi:Uma2 family endonuclease
VFAVVIDRSALGPWLEERRRLGLDRRDGVWDGVLHMVPAPAFDHDELVFAIASAFRQIATKHDLGRIGNTNVRVPGSGDRNYRVPDLVFVKNGGVTRFADGQAWIEEGPDLVVEVLSPNDESAEKLPFYAERGVPEVLLVDAATARPQLLRLVGRSYVAVGADPEGGLALESLRARLRHGPAPSGARGRLTLRDDRTGDDLAVI